jgi:hypothetical protein
MTSSAPRQRGHAAIIGLPIPLCFWSLVGLRFATTEFKITGYPTALILRSNRAELERVSGGMELGRYSEVLDLGLSATRPINDILAAATAGDLTIMLEDCRRLAYNGWPLEDEWIFSEDNPGWLEKISDALMLAASRCPAEAATERARLSIVAMAARLEAESKALKTGRRPSAKLASSVARVRQLMADRKLAIGAADDLEFLDDTFFKTAAALDPAHAAALEPTWFHLMDAIAADQRYSAADRLYTVASKVTAAKALERSGKIPSTLADEAHQRVDAALALTTDPYTRTSLVNAALNVLDALDDHDRSYAVLSGEIKTSKTPYYYMSDLAELEEQRGHKDAAVDWLARAYRESQGQATRFQWGAAYLRGLVRLRPADDEGIRTTARQVLGELDGAGRLYGRSSHGLIRLGKSLHEWNNKGEHAAAIHEIRTQVDSICTKLPEGDPALATCARFLDATMTSPRS